MAAAKVLTLFCALALLLPSALTAQTPVRVKIVQSSIGDGQLRAFFAVEDSSGASMRDLKPEHVRIVYDGRETGMVSTRWLGDRAEGTAVVLLLDVSKSLTTRSHRHMQAAARALIRRLQTRDRMTIMTVGSRARTLTEYTGDTLVLQKTIAGLARTDSTTNLHRSLRDAGDRAVVQDTALPERRVVLLFSDGHDNATGTVSTTEMLEVLRLQGVDVHALGLEGRSQAQGAKAGIDHLGVLARASGGDVIDARRLTADTIAAMLIDRMTRVHGVDVKLQEKPAPGSAAHLEIACTLGGMTVRSGRDVRSVAATGTVASPGGRTVWYLWILAVVLVGAAAVVFVHRRRRAMLARSAAALMQEVSSDYNAPTVLQNDIGSMKIRIDPIRGGDNMRTIECALMDKLVIGRDSDVDIAVHRDPHVSKRHAELRREGNAVMLVDLHSTNGTSVNGTPVMTRTRLDTGDVLTIGRTELRITIEKKHEAR